MHFPEETSGMKSGGNHLSSCASIKGAPTYTVLTCRFFSKGARKKQIYKIFFRELSKAIAERCIPPYEVEVRLYFGRRTEVGKMRFDEWLFRVEPTQAGKRPLSRLSNQMRIRSHG